MGIYVQLYREEIKKMAKEPKLTWREKALIDYILCMFKANAKLNKENDNFKKTLVSFYKTIQKKYPLVSEIVKKQDEENAKFVMEKAKAMFPPMSVPMMNPPFDGKENEKQISDK